MAETFEVRGERFLTPMELATNPSAYEKRIIIGSRDPVTEYSYAIDRLFASGRDIFCIPELVEKANSLYAYGGEQVGRLIPEVSKAQEEDSHSKAYDLGLDFLRYRTYMAILDKAFPIDIDVSTKADETSAKFLEALEAAFGKNVAIYRERLADGRLWLHDKTVDELAAEEGWILKKELAPEDRELSE